MPVDADPREDGNVTIEQPSDPRDPPSAIMLIKGPRPPMPRYVSHFATCPDADFYRRKP